MPCTDGGYSNEEYERRRHSETQNKLDKVTRLLCGLITQLETTKLGHPIVLDRETQEWWVAHQEVDRQRLIREEQERKRKVQQIKDQIKRNINGVDLTEAEIEDLITQLRNK